MIKSKENDKLGEKITIYITGHHNPYFKKWVSE